MFFFPTATLKPVLQAGLLLVLEMKLEMLSVLLGSFCLNFNRGGVAKRATVNMAEAGHIPLGLLLSAFPTFSQTTPLLNMSRDLFLFLVFLLDHHGCFS